MEWEEQEGWDQEGWDGWWSSSWSEQPASEPPAKADQQAGGIGSLDLNHLANGKRRSFAAYATKVHKPLGSAAEFSSAHDCVLWAEGGSLIPKNCALAIGLRKEYYRLKEIHGECDELPLYREGNLYNMYLKQDGVPEQLSLLQEASTSSGASAADGRQSGNARQAKEL